AGTAPADFIYGTLDPKPFRSFRSGSLFTYDIPLKSGVYEMRLHFVERQFGPDLPDGAGESSRVMQVTANGKALLSEFDIYADAGGHHILDARAFKDITPAPDGMLHLVFVARYSEALVNAIEIEPGEAGHLLPVRLVTQAAPVEVNGKR